MPGRRVDVGGSKLHINCTGEGTPVVVLDSGLGDSYVSWMKVQPQIAKFTRVCSYDRAGLGYSDNSPRPRTSKVMAEELHTLLHNGGVDPSLHPGWTLDGRIQRSPVCQSVSQRGGGHGVSGFFASGAGKAFSAGLERHGQNLGARAGIYDVGHAVRDSAIAGLLRQRCEGSCRRLQFSQLPGGSYRAENFSRKRGAGRHERVRWAICHWLCCLTIPTRRYPISPPIWLSL